MSEKTKSQTSPNSYPKPDSHLQLLWSQPRIVYDEYNPPPKHGIDFTGDPGKTDQSQSEECDVNFILKRYQKTGVLPGIDAKAVFADVSDSVTFQEALDIVQQAEIQFMSLDAHTRKRFDNDPAEFMAFVHDPRNAEELVKLGLATATPLPASSSPPGGQPGRDKAKPKPAEE